MSEWDRIVACADRLRRIGHRDAADQCIRAANHIAALEAEVGRLRGALPRRPNDVVPRWVLERAREELVRATRGRAGADQRAADILARALANSDDDAFVLVEVHHVRGE